MSVQDLARTLNRVQTAGSARFVIGRVLKHISYGYEVLDDLQEWQSGVDKRSAKLRLDALRNALEKNYKTYPQADNFILSPRTFDDAKALITKAVVEIAGWEGSSRAQRSVTLLAELGTGVENVGNTIGKATGVIGEAAGKTVAGLFSGLGVWGFLLLGVVVLVLFIRVRPV